MDALTGELRFDQYCVEMLRRITAKMTGEAFATVFMRNSGILPKIIMKTVSDNWAVLSHEDKNVVIF